ncbi:TPA: hypothetical protein PXN30_004134 [Yersinia enterocolitica]|uniref:hypothetical protein n=1 Tax=Yersinia enterocolitica TaxID=630 RepID=UPI0027ED6481|nr:hypothetical protein [Yersinia enterocolitica]HDL7180532.1 hypothetical protein [Yersinia enterocolitica]HDL7412439.1 hypothetical protein [Yersinia enterocolitica]HDL8099857.1 hypothetical protein [Yersinia enterocolitica]HDM8339896.1 hypothetical protein [Yersinia enterocolitica]
MSEILTFGLMVGQPALRNLCLAGSPRTLLAMSASRSKQTVRFVCVLPEKTVSSGLS